MIAVGISHYQWPCTLTYCEGLSLVSLIISDRAPWRTVKVYRGYLSSSVTVRPDVLWRSIADISHHQWPCALTYCEGLSLISLIISDRAPWLIVKVLFGIHHVRFHCSCTLACGRPFFCVCVLRGKLFVTVWLAETVNEISHRLMLLVTLWLAEAVSNVLIGWSCSADWPLSNNVTTANRSDCSGSGWTS